MTHITEDIFQEIPDPEIRACALVGRFLQAFADMEIALNELIQRALGLSNLQAAILCKNTDIRAKRNIAKLLIDLRFTDGRYEDLFKGFHALVDERNMVAHTYFLNDENGKGVEFLAVNAREKLDFLQTLWTVEDVQNRVKKLRTKRRHFDLAAEAMNPITMAEILKGGDKINAVLKALIEQGYPIK